MPQEPTDPLTEFPRRILLAVTGLSPQIVTETLYALAVASSPRWIPTEIRLITTTRGADNARLQLLHPKTGWFHRLRADYQLPEIAFDESHIHLIERPDGTPLDDIRDDTDNALTADTIVERVRLLTADPSSQIHASIAGGRKTMGFFLGYAMSLFGRDQDRLSHVLVSAPYESSPHFFYPTPHSNPIPRPGSASEMIDAADATVWLGDIPFVRLRDELPEERLFRPGTRFSDAVRNVQERLAPTRLVLEPETHTIVAAGQRIALKPADFAFLLWAARRRLAGRPIRRKAGSEAALLDAQEYLREYERLRTDPDDRDTSTHHRLKEGMEPTFIDERKSALKHRLQRELGLRRAEPYLFETLEGRRRNAQFQLRLEPQQIVILEEGKRP